MSLAVALYAVRLKNKSDKHPLYSYGWQRAEILGALFNGVFLLALCFSIFMEALERIVKVPEVSNPKLIVIVGSLGLASNILGLALFQGHGHPHGGAGHSHAHEHDDDHQHNDDLEVGADTSDLLSDSESLTDGMGGVVGLPARTRAFIMDKAQSLGYKSANHSEQQPLLRDAEADAYGGLEASTSHRTSVSHEDLTAEDVRRHRQATGSSAHSHGNMNMTGVFLHVLGDAIGNVGVIMTGLFIWFTEYSWRFYVDPLISFVIAMIIFHSALPLVKSASFILLQGVPHSVSIKGVRDSVLRVEGVLGLHDLHVWQLNEDKIVSSLHILVDCPGEQVARYMEIANQVRHVLHLWGIHSATIQPEFVSGVKEAARLSGVDLHPETDQQGRIRTTDGKLAHDELAKREPTCLLACDGEECREAACCNLNRRNSSSNNHDAQNNQGSSDRHTHK
ncbi:hypothetical protein MPSI1_000566 [Malassezia psittaci]|uniref:Cation efflux protein n=1 Tax=Malassezia psittaci TaxID=1821823 RepID=A0AAF0F8C4_9BASI|nr:hypothetical protein MPSI1_000566 [Malassezia psittaci]